MYQLQTHQLNYYRANKKVLENISFQLQSGELLHVLGQNGAGKSSLLLLLSSLAIPTSGKIYWQEQSIYSNRIEYTNILHYISHKNGSKLGLTVMENIQLNGYLFGNQFFDYQKILGLLSLSADQHTLIKDLSAGQKRRLALARLFSINKPLWILDEPFTTLDYAGQCILLNRLENHLQQGGLCIMSSHQSIALPNIPIKQLQLNQQ